MATATTTTTTTTIRPSANVPNKTLSNSSVRNNNYYLTTTILYVLRGPIVVIPTTISLLFPYIQEYCTVYVFAHLIIGSIGLLWLVYDIWMMIKSRMRYGLNFILNKIVLDDVLRAIYNPNDGIWACIVGTFLGASSMYGLNMDDEERTELIQSCLYLEDKIEAHNVLLEPGGYKILLPNGVQNWLQMSAKEERETDNIVGGLTGDNLDRASNDEPFSSSSYLYRVTRDSVVENSPTISLQSDRSTSDCIDNTDDTDDDELVVEESFQIPSSGNRGLRFSYRNDLDGFIDDEQPNDNITQEQHQQRTQRTTSNNIGSNSNNSRCSQIDNDPGKVFLKILQKMIVKKLQPCARSLPESTIENVGIISAMVAIGIQLVALRQQSRRNRQSNSKFPSLLGSVVCASIASISFGTVLSKDIILGNVYNIQTLQLACKDIARRMLNRWKGKLAIPDKKKGRFLAMLVLVFFCRRNARGRK